MRQIMQLLLFDDDENPDVVYENAILAYTPTAFYDASISDVWQDSARTTPAVADADVIGAWDDLSGNGYHVTQGTTANKPTLRTNVLNGFPVIRSDGSDDFLANASFPDFGDTYTVIAVAVNSVSADASQALFEVSTGTANAGFVMFHDTVGRFRGRDASGLRDVSGADYRDGAGRIHTGRNTGTAVQYRVNGSAVAASTAYTAPNPNTLSRLDIFRITGNTVYTHVGDLAALIIFNTSLSDADRDALETLLNTRYGVY